MPIRIKKLIGTLIIIMFLVVYCLAVMVLAENNQPDDTAWIQTIINIFIGFLWVVPVGAQIPRMQRPTEGANG